MYSSEFKINFVWGSNTSGASGVPYIHITIVFIIILSIILSQTENLLRFQFNLHTAMSDGDRERILMNRA